MSLELQEGVKRGSKDSVRSSEEERDLHLQRTQRRSRAFDAAFADAQKPRAVASNRNSNEVRSCLCMFLCTPRLAPPACPCGDASCCLSAGTCPDLP